MKDAYAKVISDISEAATTGKTIRTLAAKVLEIKPFPKRTQIQNISKIMQMPG